MSAEEYKFLAWLFLLLNFITLVIGVNSEFNHRKEMNQLKQKYTEVLHKYEDCVADKNGQKITREGDFIIVEPK